MVGWTKKVRWQVTMPRDPVVIALAVLWVVTLGAVVAALVNVGLENPMASALCAGSILQWCVVGHALHARLEQLQDKSSGTRDQEPLLANGQP